MAVALLNTNTMVQTAGSSASSAFTVNATGSDRCAFAIVAYDLVAGLSVTGVTYNGVAMTACGAASHSPTDHEYVEVFYLANPATGSNTLAVTMSGVSNDIYYNLVAFTGVDQTTPVRVGTYQNFTTDQALSGGSYSLVVSSNANDLTLTAINGGPSGIQTTNQTRDGNNGGGNYAAAHDHATTAAASVTHTWTGSGTNRLSIVGFSIQAVGGGGGAAQWGAQMNDTWNRIVQA